MQIKENLQQIRLCYNHNMQFLNCKMLIIFAIAFASVSVVIKFKIILFSKQKL